MVAIGRCKRVSTGCAVRSVERGVLPWTCSENPVPKAETKRRRRYTRRAGEPHDPQSLLQCLIRCKRICAAVPIPSILCADGCEPSCTREAWCDALVASQASDGWRSLLPLRRERGRSMPQARRGPVPRRISGRVTPTMAHRRAGRPAPAPCSQRGRARGRDPVAWRRCRVMRACRLRGACL